MIRTSPRACAAGSYTCGGLAYGSQRDCPEHESIQQRARQRSRHITSPTASQRGPARGSPMPEHARLRSSDACTPRGEEPSPRPPRHLHDAAAQGMHA